MIAYIDGHIAFKTPTFVVMDVQGIGYEVNISLYTYEKIVNAEKCRLLTHQVIKEDAHQLFGFIDEGERNIFRQLISITGVGPNTARMILSSLSPEELRRAIIQADITLLKTVKGIGPKAAQRIVIELQDVLKKDTVLEGPLLSEKSRILEEALAAMAALGFGKAMAEKAIARVLRENPGKLTVEELIKQALKSI